MCILLFIFIIFSLLLFFLHSCMCIITIYVLYLYIITSYTKKYKKKNTKIQSTKCEIQDTTFFSSLQKEQHKDLMEDGN